MPCRATQDGQWVMVESSDKTWPTGEGNGNLLQYSFLENPMDGGAWWTAVHGVADSRTWLSDFTYTSKFHIYALIYCICWTRLWSMWLDWLVFCDCGFQTALWRRRIRGLWKLPDGIDWLRGNLGLVLMGGAMLGKSLIQFSVDGWSCVPSLLFTWGQTIVEVMKVMGTSLKRSHACTATLSAPNPAAGHHQPTLLPETPGHPKASPGQSLVGSLLLSPASWHTRFCCASKSLFPSLV